MEKLKSELEMANKFYDILWRESIEAELKLRAVVLLIRELEAKVARASNPNEIENV